MDTIVKSPMAEFLEILDKGDCKFVVNPTNQKALRQLFNYFVMPKSELDKRKGVLLIGNPGTGKTRIMRAFNLLCSRFNGFPKFGFMTVKDLQKQVLMAERRDFGYFDDLYFSPKSTDLMIDDIGTETRSLNYFGNVSMWFEDFLLERYNLLEYYGIRTHATTNLSMKELKAFYSSRVYDRFKSMFNVVFVVGESWRGKNTP